MPAAITINPQLMTNALGSFFASSEGYVQGFALDDPALRNEICAGIVGPAVTNPMWGGVGITENLPTAGVEADSTTSILTLATSQANLTGFTVFNQSAAMIQTAQNPVPLAPATGGINFIRLGSGLRIVVACSAAVAAAYAGNPVNTAAYWDYTNQVLLSAPGGTAIAVKVVGVVTTGNAQVVATSAGAATGAWNRAGYCAVIQI